METYYSASIPSGFCTMATQPRTDQQRIDHFLITYAEKKKKELDLLYAEGVIADSQPFSLYGGKNFMPFSRKAFDEA